MDIVSGFRRFGNTLLTCLAAAALDSESMVGQTLVAGVVRSAGRPVAGADVAVLPAGVKTVTNDSGTFRLQVGDGGIVTVTVRAIGYFPFSRRYALADGDTVTVTAELERSAQHLDSVTVTGAAPVAPSMRAIEDRRRAGFGRFYTREQLAQREHSALADVLRMTAGLQLVRRPSECGGGFSVATGRGGATLWHDWMSCHNGIPFQAACYYSVYLDGVRLWVSGSKEPIDINQFAVNGLEGIELYRGPAETPIQYQGTGSACGVVMLWTRVGG